MTISTSAGTVSTDYLQAQLDQQEPLGGVAGAARFSTQDVSQHIEE